MKYHTATMHTPDSLRTKIPKCTHFYMEYQRFLDVHQGRVQDLVKGGGPEFFWLSFADSAQWSHVNEVSPYWLRSRARLRALEALGFFITKYAFSPFWLPFYTIFEIIKY